MPHASKTSASQTEVLEGFEGHYEELGGYTVGFEVSSADADLAPLFVGLPNDRCQAAHWGYVLRGKITYRFADREETYEAGDAYFASAGHTPVLSNGGEVVEFSATEELARTMEVVTNNMQSV